MIDICPRPYWLSNVHVQEFPKTGLKRKLIETTQELIIRKGFETVSVRDVTGAAKSNVASINYHFGSREALFDIISLRILHPLCQIRADQLGENHKEISVQNCISTYIRAVIPAAETIEMELSTYMQLVGKAYFYEIEKTASKLASNLQLINSQYQDSLQKPLPELPHKSLQNRWRFFTEGLHRSFVSQDPSSAPPFEDWEQFAIQGFAKHIEVPSAKAEQNDHQGLLFEF